jgi:hypothetical protein
MSKYQNIDSAKLPQEVRITYERVAVRDEPQERPDERDEGFWPSHDPEAAGYVYPENFDAEQAKAEARMKAWENDEWEYQGLFVRAHIMVPIGGGSFTCYTIESAGLWGVESEEDSSGYRDEVWLEQEQELKAHLALIGKAVA